ncbi:response regulator [Candidatus Saccharibacteria bacterium]|nr:response regulator [Candidatus Saccharibacteria bacterium]
MAKVKTILLAEDNEFIRKMYELKFGKAKLDVISVTNGAEAIEQFDKHDFGLILLDLMMPEVNGEEALEYLRTKAKKNRKVPVLILTNVNDPTTIEKIRDLGIDDYIIKSELTPSQVLNKVNQYLT